MDPIAGAQIALDICIKIYEHAQLVKCNKEQCLRLAERTRIVVETVKALVAQIPLHMLPVGRGANVPGKQTVLPPASYPAPGTPSSGTTTPALPMQAYTQALISLKGTLDDALYLVQSFSKKHWAMKVIRAHSHQDKFADIYQRLESDISQLNLGLQVHQVLKSPEQRAQDEQDKQKDYNDLLAKQDEILRLNQAMQETQQRLAMDDRNRHDVLMQQMKSMQYCLAQMQPGKKHKAPISEKLLVPFYDLKIDALLAEGSFGKVYKGRWLEQMVAIKMLERELTEGERKEFLREVHIMKQLRCEYVMPLYAVCDEPGRACIVMKYMAQGSLRTVLDNAPPRSAQEKHRLIEEIALGMHYLHSQDILHRDLKSGNVLIDDNGDARIADFGLSRLGDKSLFSQANQTHDLQWMAPEILQNAGDNRVFSEAADVYSFGVVMWEVLTGKKPYEGLSLGKVAQKVTQGENETIPNTLPKVYQTLLKECWAMEKHARPSMGKIIHRLREAATKELAFLKDLREMKATGSGYLNPSSPNLAKRQGFWELPSTPASSQQAQSQAQTSQSALQPVPETYFMAAQMYENQQQFHQAIQHYEEASNRGYARAATKLAMHYLQGTANLTQDKEKAHALLKKGAEGGHATAMRSLAYQLEKGDGVPQNLNEARIWYEKAAQAGDNYAAQKMEQLKVGGQSPAGKRIGASS